MRFLVMGAGMMGRAVAFDLCRSGGVTGVLLADLDGDRAREVEGRIASPLLRVLRLDVGDHEAVVQAMEGCDVAVSCVPYAHNLGLARAAIEAGCNFCDLGGNNDIVREELALDALAREAGVTVVPDCGLAPGLATVLAADAVKRFEVVDELHIRVGGLPLEPRPPLDYMILFNPTGLVNEYREPCVVLRDGEVRAVPPLEDVEEIEFPEPFGTMEAFNTSGGTSTLPQTFKGKVRDLDYKTVRYPGHCEKVKLLMDLGFFGGNPVEVDEGKVVPRRLTEALLLDRLPHEGDDVVLLKLWAVGDKDGQKRRLSYTVVDPCDRANGMTAMMRTTAYPASIVAQMLASGEIARKGAVPQELVVPTERFLEELEGRGIVPDIRWE